MRLTAVGTGTVVPHAQRVCACLHVAAAGHSLLLDCGPGALHHMERFGVPWAELDTVALTHFHTDHIGGLPILLFALEHGLARKRRKPLRIAGPVGTAELLGRLAAAFGDYMTAPGFGVDVLELRDTADLGGVRLAVAAVPHTPESVAYRVEAEGRTLGYTGDTGESAELNRFLDRVDLLVAECSLPDAIAMATHLTPARVARLAAASRPGMLAVTHIYPQLDRAALPDLVREAGWSGPLLVLDDGASLPVGAG